MNNCLNFDIIEIVRLKRHDKIKTITNNKECYVIGYRFSGESTFFLKEKTITAKQGDIIYIPAGSTYYQICNEKEELICFHLNVFGMAPKELTVFTPENPDEIRVLFEKVCKIWTDKNKNYIYCCLSILYTVISQCDFITPKNKQDSIIKNSVDYINDHFSDPDISLDYASKASNVSRAYFNRIFIKEFGTTPIKYIQKKRIEKAMFLISSGDYTREEIATFCGFKDVKYFYTVFKKVTGVTTKEYCLNRALKPT